MAGKNSNENKEWMKKCLASAISGSVELKILGYKNGSEDLIFEITRSSIDKRNDNLIFRLSNEIEFEGPLCCFLKYKLGKPKIKNFQELKELMSEIHGKEEHCNKIKQKYIDKMLEKLTKKLRNIDGVSDNEDLLLLNRELCISDIKFSKQKILNLVEQKSGYGYVKKELSDMMDEILRLYRDVTYGNIIDRIYNEMLFGSGEYRLRKSMEDLKEFGIVDDTHPLPEDYPLIENGIITSMDELLDILSTFHDNRIYLCLDSHEFSEALIERIVGKKKLIELIANANNEQLEKLAILEEASMPKDYNCGSYVSMLEVFLASSQDSDKIQRVLNVVLEYKNLTADMVRGFEFRGWNAVQGNFYNNSIQISVDSFERLLNVKYKRQKEKIFCLNDNNLLELWDLLKLGIKCCSEDMSQNNKKIDLKEIFKEVSIKEGRNEWHLSMFANFVFANIDKLGLDGRFMSLICSSFIQSYNRKIIENKGLSVVIGAILQKQNFIYTDNSTMRQKFEAECKKAGINIAFDQDGIFFVDTKLYFVGKGIGVVQFDSLDNFIEYVYSNINALENKRYVDSLAKLVDDNYNRWANGDHWMLIESKISDDFRTVSNIRVGSISFYNLCLILKILESQNVSESLLNKLGNMPPQRDSFDSFCFKVYMYVIFPLEGLFRDSHRQPKIVKDNKITQSEKNNDGKIPMVPESAFKIGQHQCHINY